MASEVLTYRLTPDELAHYRSLEPPKPERGERTTRRTKTRKEDESMSVETRIAQLIAEGVAPERIRKQEIVSKKTLAAATERLGVEWVGDRWENIAKTPEPPDQNGADASEAQVEASTPPAGKSDEPAPVPDGQGVHRETGTEGEAAAEVRAETPQVADARVGETPVLEAIGMITRVLDGLQSQIDAINAAAKDAVRIDIGMTKVDALNAFASAVHLDALEWSDLDLTPEDRQSLERVIAVARQVAEAVLLA